MSGMLLGKCGDDKFYCLYSFNGSLSGLLKKVKCFCVYGLIWMVLYFMLWFLRCVIVVLMLLMLKVR